MKISYINPETMAKPRGYSHAITVEGNHKTIYIGGQYAIDENGNLIGKNDLMKQTEQVLTNIEKIIEEVGAEIENIVKLNIYLLQGKNPQGVSSVSGKMGNKSKFSSKTVLFVTGLSNPDWLIEIRNRSNPGIIVVFMALAKFKKVYHLFLGKYGNITHFPQMSTKMPPLFSIR